MQEMHKCDDDGGDGGDFFTTIVSTFMGKCKRKRTATLGSTGREGGSQLDLLPFIELKSV